MYPETEPVLREGHFEAPARSKIKLVRNAKGEAQWEISVVEGTSEEDLNQLRQLAVAQWQALETEL